MLNLDSSFECATYNIRRQFPMNAFAVVRLLLDLFFTLFNYCPWTHTNFRQKRLPDIIPTYVMVQLVCTFPSDSDSRQAGHRHRAETNASTSCCHALSFPIEAIKT
jgi:hypothetical protein